jgi:hypothetical protein
MTELSGNPSSDCHVRTIHAGAAHDVTVKKIAINPRHVYDFTRNIFLEYQPLPEISIAIFFHYLPVRKLGKGPNFYPKGDRIDRIDLIDNTANKVNTVNTVIREESATTERGPPA